MTYEPLSDEQLRVLGALIEKESTVPDTYPMTLKGLITACNQKNNREPVTDLDSFTVQRTLDELKALGLVRFVYVSHGARSTKYRHVFDEKYDVESDAQSVLAVLMLRGPNTVNELRTRTERYYRFESNEEVEEVLDQLAARSQPLVTLLPTQPGQREARWAHLLAGDVIDHDPPSATAPASAATPPAAPAPSPPTQPAADRVAALESRVSELEGQVRYLMEELGVSPSKSPGEADEETEV